MKKLILFLSLWLVIAVSLQADAIQCIHFVDVEPVGGGGSYSYITHFWTTETQNSPWWDSGVDCSDEDTTPTPDSTCSIDAAGAHVGSSYHLAGDTSWHRFIWVNTQSVGSMRIGFWFRINSWQDEGSMLRIDTDGTDIRIRLVSSDELYIYMGSQICVTTGQSYNDGTWRFLEIVLDDVNEDRDLIVDNVLVASSDVAWSGDTSIQMELGNCGFVTLDVDIDGPIIVTDDPTQSLYPLRNETDKDNLAGACDG